MPLGQASGFSRADPGGRGTPRFRHRLIRFRHFIDGSLALASLNLACRDHVPAFPQRSQPSLLTTAARGGLRPAPDCRPRRALLHLSYSSAPSYSDGAFVTHAPLPTFASRTCSGLRLQKRAVLLASGNRGSGLSNDTHRRHHGPRPKAYPPNTGAREIRDFGNPLRHHDVDRQRRELNELLDESKVVEAGHKNSICTGIGISFCTLCRFIQAFIRRSEFQQERIGSRIDEQMNSEFLCSVPHRFDLRCMPIGTDELPLSAEEPVFDIDPYRASLQKSRSPTPRQPPACRHILPPDRLIPEIG